MRRQCKVLGWRSAGRVEAWRVVRGQRTPDSWAWPRARAVWGAWLVRRTVGEPGMPLHGKWLGPGALGRSASIRAGIVWASFGASLKDCMLSAFSWHLQESYRAGVSWRSVSRPRRQSKALQQTKLWARSGLGAWLSGASFWVGAPSFCMPFTSL